LVRSEARALMPAATARSISTACGDNVTLTKIEPFADPYSNACLMDPPATARRERSSIRVPSLSLSASAIERAAQGGISTARAYGRRGTLAHDRGPRRDRMAKHEAIRDVGVGLREAQR